MTPHQRLGLIVLIAAFAWLLWSWRPSGRKLPKNRVRAMSIRLHLRMRPGLGFATAFALWLRWGRFASFRKSRFSRPSMHWADRAVHAREHSILLARAQRWFGLRLPVEEHVLMMSPPRSFKTAALARWIFRFPGAVVATSTKPDLFSLTSGIRKLLGSQPITFNPQGIGRCPSTIRWDPIPGCQVPSVAIRRADAMTGAVNMGGTEDASFWAGKASSYLRALFHAAALANADMWKVTEWALGSAQQAEEILASHGAVQWAAELGELRGEALRTAATIRMVLSRALALMNDPVLATAVMPSEGTGFDPEAFLRSRSTLYMIASTEQAESPLAPLFAMLAAEIHYTAIQVGSHMNGGRMDPPLLMALDEVTQICPVPLPVRLSDSGGKGIQIISIVHGAGQLKERWKEHGAQIVMDTSGCKVFMPGITDTNTLEMASKISGKASYREEGEDKDSRHEKLTPDMIRQLPPSFALIVRGGYAPVIGRLPKAWRDRLYRKAKRHGQAIAPLVPVEGLEAAQEAQVVLMPERPAAAVAARQLALVPDIEADFEGELLEAPPATYPWREWQTRFLPAVAEMITKECKGCAHAREIPVVNGRPAS